MFATRNVAEAGPAILTAPAFLSGLSPVEIEIVRTQYERTVNPSIADAKIETLNALAHAEAGFRNAANLIRARDGLDKVGNGTAA